MKPGHSTRNIQQIDYTNVEEVIGLAWELGSDCIVVKHAGRPNYNITRAARRDLYKPEEVVWPPSRTIIAPQGA